MTVLRRRVTGAVLVLLAALAPLAAALPAQATGGTTSGTTPSPTPSPSGTTGGTGTGTGASPAVLVQITTISPEVLGPGQDLVVTATLRNEGAAPLDDVTADLRLNRFRPASRADLDNWVTGTSGQTGSRLARTDPVSIPAGGTATVHLTAPATSIRLLDVPDTWGPRGLAVEAVAADGTQLGIQRTFALWQRDDEVVPQVRVSVLAPVTGATSSVTALEQATATGGRLRAVADLATAEPDVELAVDPALLAAAGTASTQTKSWAGELTAALARRDAFALPWGDTDLAAVAHAGRTDLLRTAVGLSGSSGLSGVDARTDVLWAPDGTLDQQTVDTAAAAGARAIVVGPDTLQTSTGVSTAVADLDTDDGQLAALVPDGLLTTLFVHPATVEPGATTATAVQRLLAELAVLAHDGTGQQHDVLVAPGRDWTPNATLVSALLDALRASPWSRLVPVSALLGSADDGAQRTALPATSVDAGELPPGDVDALADAWTGTTAFARAIGDAGSLTGGLAQRVLAPLSVAWRADPTGRADLVHRVTADTATTLAGLSLTGPPSLNVISASAPVRFVVRNDLAVPAAVQVSVQPRKGCLRPTRSDLVTAAPHSQTPVVVDLAAAANCDVTVEAMLVGADGQAVGDGVQFAARVAPTIEDVGTIVVGVLLAIGLVLGIVRTVRRGQSARRGARRAPEDAAPLPVLGGEVVPDEATKAEEEASPPAGPGTPTEGTTGEERA